MVSVILPNFHIFLICSAIAFEVTNNIGTVASLHKEEYFLDRFNKASETGKSNDRKSAILRGIAQYGKTITSVK